jgi:hypothetical protein
MFRGCAVARAMRDRFHVRLAIVVAIVLAACDPGPNGIFHFDARAADSQQQPPGCMPPPGPLCPLAASLCGNGMIDSCYSQSMPGHCSYFTGGTEACDGTATKTCESYGYYGGTIVCAADCKGFDTTGCQACNPATSSCVQRMQRLEHGIAVSGPYVAVATASSIVINNGLTFVTEPALANVSAIVDVPNGWLVATNNPPAMQTLDPSGVLGSAHALPAGATSPALAANASGRVVVAWNELVGADTHVFAALADGTGNVVVPAQDLFASDGSIVAATSDGTSFFVGAAGKLARVATDGTVAITSGFPISSGMPIYAITDLSWRGTTGWYVAGDQVTTSYVAQQVDSNGVLVGAPRPITIFRAIDFLDDGDDLLAFVWMGAVRVYRYRADGTVASSGDIGVSYGQPAAQLAHYGSQLLVAWERSLALIP